MMGIRNTLKLVTFNPFKETRLDREKLIRRIQRAKIDLSKITLEGVYILHISHSYTGKNWLKVGKTRKDALTKRITQIEREFNSINGYSVTPLYWSVNYGLYWEKHTCYLFEQRAIEFLRLKGLINDKSFKMYRNELFGLTNSENKEKASIVSDCKDHIDTLWRNPKAHNVGHFGRLS